MTDITTETGAESADETTVPAEDTAEGAAEGVADADSGSEAVSKGGPSKAAKEAKRYRLALRETESKLAEAHERISGYQRTIVEIIAKQGHGDGYQHYALADPADLWTLTDKQPEDFLNENGDVDPDLVHEAVRELLRTRPGLRQLSAVDRTPARGGAVDRTPTWADLFRI